jgi:ribosomal protein S18 acetylase RimI-like enzyme
MAGPDRHPTRLTALTREQFAAVAELAARIWHSHYAGIISPAQIDYMLGGRFCAANLEQYLGSATAGLWVLWHAGQPVGYCSYATTESPAQLKLEQLYLLAEFRGQGMGRSMLDHVETIARQRGCSTLVLAVNKANAGSIALYRKRGFSVRDEVRLEIGAGFVMDDYVMEKSLGAGGLAQSL